MTSRERAKCPGRRLAIIRHAKEVSGHVSQTCRYGRAGCVAEGSLDSGYRSRSRGIQTFDGRLM